MCGITGIVSQSPLQDRERQDEIIRRMTQILAHRGPDDEGFYEDDFARLGQRRLSIIDLAGGHQPIADDTGDLLLVCNGEIYNSPELRKAAEAGGYPFKTHTDVEVILPLYRKYGRDCVKHLRGMFAFAIWDRRERSLFLARDHMGQKPLFFMPLEGEIRFASEVKALLASEEGTPKPNMECIWHYISMRFVPDQLSFFEGIEKLPASSWLFWKDGALRVERYWEPEFKHKLTASKEQAEEQLNDVLRDTVKSHLLSDVRVGAFLSGGLDSGTVSAMMAEETSEPVPVFSIGVAENEFNELPYARMVTEKYGMEAHEKVVNADLIHLIPKMIYHMDEPSDPFGVGVYLVSQMAREHVKVVLTGDGGDESFVGYDRFSGQRLAEYYAMLPEWLRKQVMTRAINLIPDSFGYKSAASKAKWLNEMSFYKAGDRYAQSMSFLRFTQQAKEELFTKQAKAQIVERNSNEKLLRHFNAENADELIERMLFTDMMTRLPDHLLLIADRMTMAHSLESRAPLVDHKLVEFAASLPANYKLKGTDLKHILKKTASRYLPKELIYREKQGFGFPIARWMRTDLNVFLRSLFSQSRFVELGIFEQATIDRLLAEHLGGQADHNFRLWILLNLELWYRVYFENQSQNQMREFTDRLMAA